MTKRSSKVTEPSSDITIEEIIVALAGQCDGAKTRDGRGFNKGDANEGGRLAGLYSAGIPWSIEDARKATEIISKYSKQAGVHLSDGDEGRQGRIELAVRSNKVMLGNAPTDNQKAYNFAGLSSGGKQVYLWKMAWLSDFKGLFNGLREISALKHGHRKIEFHRTPAAEMTINGERRKFDRMEIDLNGTTQEPILELCRQHNFVVEPSVASPIDPEIDRIRKFARSAWIHTGVRGGEKGEWAVFDLLVKSDQFSSAVKANLRGKFVCDPADDWNWFVRLDDETRAMIRKIAIHFKFAPSREFDLKTRQKEAIE